MATATTSRNPFLDPSISRNPFLSRINQSSTPSISQSPAATPDVVVAPSPEPQLPDVTTSVTPDVPTEPPAIQSPPPLPPRPTYAPPPGPPPSVLAAQSSPSRSPSPPPPSFSTESPPPYSAAPDVRTGELSLEYGPSRPFQNRNQRPVASPQQRFIAPHTTGQSGRSWYDSIASSVTGSSRNGASSSWSQFPGNIPHHSRPALNGPYLYPQSTGTSGSRSHPDLRHTASEYAPPPGRPPASNDDLAISSNRDDGSPTTMPTPGRPLLKDGRVLVYPQGYECPKCNNMGYKNMDPSHPCSKCWQKYAKPYTGALTYAPWSNRSPDSNFQRPLPRTLGPPPRPSVLTRPTVGRSSWGGPESPMLRGGMSPWSGPGPAMSPGIPQVNFVRGAPPPGAIVVQPGDPRIGGRICWKCGGEGETLSFPFIIDRCRVCNGMGRIL